MIEKSIPVFILKNEDIAKKMCYEIQILADEVCFVKDYFNSKIIYVLNDIDYRLVTLVGNFIAFKNQYDVEWVDKEEIVKPINDFCICKLREDFFTKNCEHKIKKFARKLSEKIGIPVRYNFSPFTYVNEIHISISDIFLMHECFRTSLYELYKNDFDIIAKCTLDKIVDFVDDYLKQEKISIYDIEVYDFDTEIYFTKAQEEFFERMSFDEYFKSSALYTGIRYPEGVTIAPKTKYDEIESSKYFVTHSAYDLRESREYDFKKTEKGLTRSKDYVIAYEEICDNSSYNHFSFHDTLKVEYSIEFLSDTKLQVVSKVKGTRKTDGQKKAPSKTVFDEILKGAKYCDCEYEFVSTDYYEAIDFNLLLHYTDSSKFYETYKIPVGFEFSNGILVLPSSIVYNDDSKNWINYEDISEVIEALTK